MKNYETINYLALCDIPICGIKKNDIIFLNNTGFQVMNSVTGMKKDFPNNIAFSIINFEDKTFFKKLYNAKYKVDDMVLVNKKDGRKWYGTIKKISQYGVFGVSYDIHTTGGETLRNVYECDIIDRAVRYWFCDSKGHVCQTFIGKEVEADNWRKTIGNMFDTKDEVVEYKIRLCNSQNGNLTKDLEK